MTNLKIGQPFGSVITMHCDYCRTVLRNCSGVSDLCAEAAVPDLRGACVCAGAGAALWIYCGFADGSSAL